MAARVKSIFIYPIKSCRGISVSKAPVSVTGFVWDRHWLVINSKGRACTQRTQPNLALVQVDLPSEAFSLGWEPNSSSYLGQGRRIRRDRGCPAPCFFADKCRYINNKQSVVRAPGMAELKVSMAKPCIRSDGVSLWGWTGSALDEGDEAAKWFTEFIGEPTRLVRFNDESETRRVDPVYASGFNVKFPDSFPFLLISEASLDAVNQQLKEPVSINRFRPNMLVIGCDAFAEDLWKQIKINDLTFQGVKLCPRCKIPSINQEDATQGSEPTQSMIKFRSGKALEVNTTVSKIKESVVYLGQMLVCPEKDKFVGVGDIIEVEKIFPSYADVPV
ncbi:hypothetical protein R6Q57_017232 [Mikania cordata]